MSDNETTNESDDQQQANEQKSDDTAGLKSALDKERDARKTADKELKDLRTKIAKLEAKDQTDLERLTGERDTLANRVTELEQRNRTTAGRVAAVDAARKANAIAPNAVYALIRDDLEFNTDDEPTNIDSLIANAKKAEPSLFQASAGSGDGGKGSNGKGVDGPAAINQLLRQATGIIS